MKSVQTRNKGRTGSYKGSIFLCFLFFIKVKIVKRKFIAILHSYIKRKNKCLNKRINFLQFSFQPGYKLLIFCFQIVDLLFQLPDLVRFMYMTALNLLSIVI